jgi:hypothetical protein
MKLSLTILENKDVDEEGYELVVPTDWINIDFAETFPKIRNLKVKCCKNTVFGQDNMALLRKLQDLETLEIGYVCGFGISKELVSLFERCPKLRHINVDYSKVKLSAKERHEVIVSKHPELERILKY